MSVSASSSSSSEFEANFDPPLRFLAVQIFLRLAGSFRVSCNVSFAKSLVAIFAGRMLAAPSPRARQIISAESAKENAVSLIGGRRVYIFLFFFSRLCQRLLPELRSSSYSEFCRRIGACQNRKRLGEIAKEIAKKLICAANT